jgi:hypothetical protein
MARVPTSPGTYEEGYAAGVVNAQRAICDRMTELAQTGDYEQNWKLLSKEIRAHIEADTPLRRQVAEEDAALVAEGVIDRDSPTEPLFRESAAPPLVTAQVITGRENGEDGHPGESESERERGQRLDAERQAAREAKLAEAERNAVPALQKATAVWG